MSILDDAIREHLELKRAHGADDSELKKLEDEAFGPPQRPDEADPFAEAPTEFLAAPGEAAADAPAVADEAAGSVVVPTSPTCRSRRLARARPTRPGMPPPAPSGDAAAPEDELSPTPDAPPPAPTDAADVPLPPPPGEAPAADLAPPTGNDESTGSFFDQFSAPAEESDAPTDAAPAAPGTADRRSPGAAHGRRARPADRRRARPADPTRPAPSSQTDDAPEAEEPDAFVDQPTQMFDVQAHVDAEAAADAPATGEQASPTDEELVEAAAQEPQAAPPAPEENVVPSTELEEQPQLNLRGPDAEVAGHPPAETEAEEGSAEFDFFNEQRLSDELDQALEAPLPPTDEHLAMPQYKDAPAESGGVFDFQGGTETYEEDPSQEVLRRARRSRSGRGACLRRRGRSRLRPRNRPRGLLEDTPRFLEDAPEDDDLWFEQKPPKDFDLD